MCIYVYKYERSADKRNRCVALSLFLGIGTEFWVAACQTRHEFTPVCQVTPFCCQPSAQCNWRASPSRQCGLLLSRSHGSALHGHDPTHTGCAGGPVAMGITAPSCAPASLQLRTSPAMQLLQPCRAAETPLIPWRQSAQVWRPHIFLPHLFFNFLNLHY